MIVVAAIVIVVTVATEIGGRLFDETLRRRLEANMNQRLTGYTAHLAAVEFHPFAFSLTLLGLDVRQNAHPKPSVIVIDTLHAGVHWRALLHLRLVADFGLDGVHLHINQPQLLSEANDKVKLKDKGWQEALESIYPLKINQFRLTNGALTYIDDDPQHPLELTHASLLATNIRNVHSPDETYPSPVHFDAVLFDRGRVRLDGSANFVAEPQASVRAHIDVQNVPLQRLKPVAGHANLQVSGGTLADLVADIEYAPKIESVHVRRARIDDVKIDYVHTPQTEAAEAHRVEVVKEKAGEIADRPTVSARVDSFTLHNADLGYVDKTRAPYSIFLSGANVDVSNLSNQSNAGMAGVIITGLFMDSGPSRLEASFLPRRNNPKFDLSVSIQQTQMREMNDLFRAYGDFDVVGGTFSFYSQLEINDGRIDGYIKPLFADVHVYDRRQDKDKALFQQMYEALVGGVSGLLENRSQQVATEATLAGQASTPELSTWEAIVNLVRNAFFRAILPGFDKAVRGAAPGNASAESAPSK